MSSPDPSAAPLDITLLDTACGTLYWREGCFFYFRAEAGCNLRPEDVVPFLDAAKAHLEERTVGPTKAPLLNDRRPSYSSTFEARSRFAAWASEHLSAIAWCAPNPMAFMAAESAHSQYVMVEDLLPTEMRIFGNEDSALQWIKRVATYDVARTLAARFKDDPNAAPVLADAPPSTSAGETDDIQQDASP